MTTDTTPPIIADDLFAGAGGWDIAARHLGIHARGVENMTEARATRAAADLPTIHDDVWTYQPDGTASGLIASPPCQTFSQAGNGHGRKALDDVLQAIKLGLCEDLADLRAFGEQVGDDRTGLVLTPLHFALTGGYRWLAWEQVPTVLPVWEACAERLEADGWHVWTGRLNAEQYGVPQTRKRAFLIASLDHPVAPPTPTHSRFYSRTPDKLDPGVKKWVSMAEALGWGLRQRPSFTVCGVSAHAVGDTEWGGASVRNALKDARDSGDPERWALASGTRPNATVRNMDQPATTLAFGHDAASYAIVPEGMKPEDVPAAKLKGEAVRITVAEAAKLQSFPADHPLQGGKSRQFLQIGNAVPPLMAEAVLSSVLGQPLPS